ncbi:hypothetical protein PV327_010072 [Microctonus hyperodae]|uniref:Uncharacterized protein n=1 Tax=Microctonus hyperodae TaxID=165561 RepID=A0AA39F2B1_MICHY|nr:hypothetical protein PV327_010072 [Microctonus hyperodae]
MRESERLWRQTTKTGMPMGEYRYLHLNPEERRIRGFQEDLAFGRCTMGEFLSQIFPPQKVDMKRKLYDEPEGSAECVEDVCLADLPDPAALSTGSPANAPPRRTATPSAVLPYTIEYASPGSLSPPSPPRISFSNSFRLLDVSVERERREGPSGSTNGVEEWALNLPMPGSETNRRISPVTSRSNGTGTRNNRSPIPIPQPQSFPNPQPGCERRAARSSQPNPRNAIIARQRPRPAATDRDGELRRALIAEAEAVVTVDEMKTVADKLNGFLQARSARGNDDNNRDRRDRRPQRPREQARVVDRVQDATRVQQLYRDNRRAAMREVLEGLSPHCEVSREEMERYFRRMYAPEVPEEVEPHTWPEWYVENEDELKEALERHFQRWRWQNACPGRIKVLLDRTMSPMKT